MGTNDRGTVRLNVGFVNCRGWWSREVDLKRFDVLVLAEAFLQYDEEVSMAWYVLVW